MNRLEIDAAAAWLRDQLARVAFGEVGVKLIVHDGKVSRIERTIVEKALGEVPASGKSA